MRISSAAFKPSSDLYKGLSLGHEKILIYLGISTLGWSPEKAVAITPCRRANCARWREPKWDGTPLRTTLLTAALGA